MVSTVRAIFSQLTETEAWKVYCAALHTCRTVQYRIGGSSGAREPAFWPEAFCGKCDTNSISGTSYRLSTYNSVQSK